MKWFKKYTLKFVVDGSVNTRRCVVFGKSLRNTVLCSEMYVDKALAELTNDNKTLTRKLDDLAYELESLKEHQEEIQKIADGKLLKYKVTYKAINQCADRILCHYIQDNGPWTLFYRVVDGCRFVVASIANEDILSIVIDTDTLVTPTPVS